MIPASSNFLEIFMDEAECGRGTRLRSLDQPMLRFSALLCFQGYCLLYEAMLPSVLLARDRWLKPVRGVDFICSSVDLTF